MGKKYKKEGKKKVATVADMMPVATTIASAERMRSLAEKYPWFDSAVLALADGDARVLPVHIVLRKSVFPALNLYRKVVVEEPVSVKPVEEDLSVEAELLVADNKPVIDKSANEKQEFSTIDIIEEFIDKGEHKVAATDTTPEYIPEITLDGIPDDDELLTEELAEVYLNQELFDHAKVIYDRLSLLYPKKSVYFAEIIENAMHGKSLAENNNK